MPPTSFNITFVIVSILAVLAWWLYWKDDTTAMAELGLLYEIGLGVPQDYGKAREWYAKAAAKGDLDAKARLEKLGTR